MDTTTFVFAMSVTIIGALVSLYGINVWFDRSICRDYEEFKSKQPPQPSKEDRFQTETFTRLTAISNQLAGIKGSLTAIEADTLDNARDMEALRRKLHEMAGDVKRINSVFATVPTAEPVND